MECESGIFDEDNGVIKGSSEVCMWGHNGGKLLYFCVALVPLCVYSSDDSVFGYWIIVHSRANVIDQ